MSSDPPDSDREEVTEVTRRALRGDPLAEKVKMHEKAIDKLQRHFEDGGEGKRGIVIQIDRKLDTFITQHGTKKALFASVPSWLGVVVVLVGALGWFVAATVRSQQPTPQDIAREVVRQSQK